MLFVNALGTFLESDSRLSNDSTAFAGQFGLQGKIGGANLLGGVGFYSLEAAGKSVQFRDVRAEPLSDSERDRFIDAFGDRIINRASTTWRGLSDWMKASETDAQLEGHPTLMKRPVIETEDQLLLGWGSDVQLAVLGQ